MQTRMVLYPAPVGMGESDCAICQIAGARRSRQLLCVALSTVELLLIRLVQVVSFDCGVDACEFGATRKRDTNAKEVKTANTFFTQEFYFPHFLHTQKQEGAITQEMKVRAGFKGLFDMP